MTRIMPRELWWVSVLAVVLVAGGVWWLLPRGHRHLILPAVPTPTVPDDIQIRLSNVHLRGVSDGKVVWEVIADNFDLSKNRPVLHIQGLKQVSVLNDGKQELSVTADAVEQNTVTGNISLLGNVNVTGAKLLMHTPSVIWDALHSSLHFPKDVSAQVGDFTLALSGSTAFDARNYRLHCDGPVVLITQGNSIRAGSADIDMQTKEFNLHRPVQAEFKVADMEAWAAGQNLPQIPTIPPGVQQRYRDYCRKQGFGAPGASSGFGF